MTPEGCPHPRRVGGILEVDLARQATPHGPLYSVQLAVSVCESCGHIELYAKSHRELCIWLKGAEDQTGPRPQ
jgi:hypothetical protein